MTRPGVGLWWGFSCGPVPCGGVRRPFSRVFDTPVDALSSNGSRGVREGPGCVDRQVRVSLLLAAQHGGLAPGDWGGLLVRWWFENSRAYLYYFFIVNDCQFVAGHADAWCRGIGQTAARFLCDAPFLIRRSSIFLDESHMLAFRISFFVEGSILAQDERWRRA